MMSEFKHKEKFPITTYHADQKRTVTPSAVLGFMQEVATNHAKLLGLGYRDSMKNGFIWVLRSTKYEFDKTPVLNDVLEIHTWPAGIEGLRELRRFDFYLDDVKIGQGYNYWLMMDISTMKPKMYPYFIEKTKELPITKDDYFRLPKIAIVKDLHFSHDKEVQNSDLDWNNHVNNVRYAEMVFNAIPIEWVLDKSIVNFQIDYLKECKIHDKISVFYNLENHNLYVEGKVDNQTMFRSKVVFK